ncbi:hypothetical protein BJAS_P1445 [Bathymodiolus japonicus methanotrophic gill symbiont]|uniref:DUF481 domain-containing protein n=1 Tax=Bathymodiolus japonicus methanotrophic gill symbiont TaxID=113269 RepID=UPI001B74AD55|nr:DUF481 domain-containing protein [Bathymodiolus japonicus methanotrophic gill symbiont]GFO71758.1 hypothetical protein BJAS_P1445 [Bathymodiolus japonicus methanotrophic gill symbiont]
MNYKQLFLLLSTLLACLSVYAQPIQFANGDTLDVELKCQKDKTITFSHAILGEQTIDKAKIRNLQELNLERVIRFSETELNDLKILKAAKIAVTVAKDGVRNAEADLVSAKKAVDNAEEKDKEITEEKLVLAADKLATDQEGVTTAEDNLKMLKKTVVAEAELVVAKNKLKVAKAEVKVNELTVEVTEAQEDAVEQQEIIATGEELALAGEKFVASQAEVKVSEEELRVVRTVIKADDDPAINLESLLVAETEPKGAQAEVNVAEGEVKETELNAKVAATEEKLNEEPGVVVTKEKLEIAKDNVDIAEEKVEVAKQEVEVAEDNLKLAKGEKVDDGLLGTGWFKGWDSSLSVGLSGSSGSSVNSTFRTAFNTRYEDKEGRWDYKSFYFRDSEDKVTGENQVNATLVKDWFFADSKWFAFARGVYDWNQFKDWNHRIQFGGGPGYQFVKAPTWELSGRMGATIITEFCKTQFDSDGNPIIDSNGKTVEDNVVGFEGLLGADVTWHITAKQHFSISNYFYPSFTDSGQFRNLTNISWIHSLGWFEGLALKFGIRNEYDTSETIPNEFNYNFSILWGF